MLRLFQNVKRYWRPIVAIYVVSSLWWGPTAEAAFRLELADESFKGIAAIDVTGLVTAPRDTLADSYGQPRPVRRSAPTSWDCIARYESGNRPLGCAPYCGRLQWLPSTWRSAGGTRYASLPQNATWEQEKEIASLWLTKTSWGQWPTTSRLCGFRR